MIATLSGTVAEKLGELVILDVAGVGYGLLVPNEDYGRLPIGEQATLYIYEHIRENAHDLYGFIKLDTKRLFEQLLEVTGVGPKMALSVLSIGNVQAVRAAIASGDTKFIQAANGVGKRVAERVVVELKDKVGVMATADIDALFRGEGVAKKDEAVQALLSLGYTLPDAVAALSTVKGDLSTEERIKEALRSNG